MSGTLNEGSVGGFFSVFQPWEAEGTEGPVGRVSSVFQPRGVRGTVSGRGWPGAIGVEYVIVFKCCEFCSECENVKIVCIEYFLSAKEMSLKAKNINFKRKFLFL